MELPAVLDALFPDGHDVRRDGALVSGTGRCGGTDVAVVGTTDRAAIGVDLALALAQCCLDVIRRHPRRPILLLVDNQGQNLARREEMLGVFAYLAHLAEVLEVARSRGHRIVSLVYGEAVSGGFLAAGMIADETYALPDAQIRVMALPAMARVTRIPLERLEALCASSPIFAPGVENFVRLGIVEAVWTGDLAGRLREALARAAAGDRRRALGAERGGRTLAEAVAARVRDA
jgi:malonate decarboxylase gamma subunit